MSPEEVSKAESEYDQYLLRMPREYRQAHKEAYRHRESLDAAGVNSCFYCLGYSTIADVREWTDNEQTAICPHCGIDAVLPGERSKEFLKGMYRWWFDNGEVPY